MPRILVGVLVLAALVACQRSDPHVGLTGGEMVYEQEFEDDSWRESWRTTSNAWVIEEGWMSVQGARNAPLFLDMELPENVRIEFRVRSLSDEGDIKFEVFTDGENHESGYIGIFGGWNNSMNIIARLDEHGDDKHIGAEGQAVTRNRIYEMAIVRTDNRLRWYVDGRSFLTYSDDEPLRGEGHEYFALNDWDAPLQFDDVRVYDLGDL